MITNSDVDLILTKIEPEIISITKYFALSCRDEIKQEARIKLWNMLSDAFQETYTIEDLEKFCLNNLYFVVFVSSKKIMAERNKYAKRHILIDDHLQYEEPYRNIDSKIDIEKYRKILTKKEFMMIEYLFNTDNDFDNFDSISRQLGYTGKGASKYSLNKIAIKILEFEKTGEIPSKK